MTVQTRHRILRQVLDIDVGTPAGAHEVQDALAVPFRNGNLPGLEQLFDRIASPNVHVRVDRVEVDLGTVTGTDWYELFFDRLCNELNSALETNDLPGTVSGADVVISQHARSDNAIERFLFYLEHGRLPWWSGRPDEPDWIGTVSSRLTATHWQELLNVLQRSEYAQARFVAAVDDRVLERAIAVWATLTETRRAMEILSALEDRKLAVAPWRNRFWQILVGRVASGTLEGPPLLRALLQALIEFAQGADMPHSADTPSIRIRRWFDSLAKAAPSFPEPWQTWVHQVISDVPRSIIVEGPADPAPGIDANDPPAATKHDTQDTLFGDTGRREPRRDAAVPHEPESHDASLSNDALLSGQVISIQDWLAGKRERATDSETHQAFQFEDDELTEVYVDGAGIVIVHPFLRELFDSRGLLRDDDFVDNTARQKAVHLMAYLTFGTDPRPEYELLLAKLLCNVPWDVPLIDIELDDEDRVACDELLEAVLGHWSVLKGCSVPWMRDQYLLRDGKLEQVDHGWKLTVERHAQDVLLAKLPWGFGMIRLPWQPAFLYLNWLD